MYSTVVNSVEGGTEIQQYHSTHVTGINRSNNLIVHGDDGSLG